MRKKHQLPGPPPAPMMNKEHQLPGPPPAPGMNKQYKGYNGTMVLTDAFVIIKREGVKLSRTAGFKRGDKTIPYASIIAVQYMKAGRGGGYIQLTLRGGTEGDGGMLKSIGDENSIHFNRKANDKFLEAKLFIEQRISQSSIPQTTPNPTPPPPPAQDNYFEELEKLAALRDKGIITEDDFNAKKSKLLGL